MQSKRGFHIPPNYRRAFLLVDEVYLRQGIQQMIRDKILPADDCVPWANMIYVRVGMFPCTFKQACSLASAVMFTWMWPQLTVKCIVFRAMCQTGWFITCYIEPLLTGRLVSMCFVLCVLEVVQCRSFCFSSYIHVCNSGNLSKVCCPVWPCLCLSRNRTFQGIHSCIMSRMLQWNRANIATALLPACSLDVCINTRASIQPLLSPYHISNSTLYLHLQAYFLVSVCI